MVVSFSFFGAFKSYVPNSQVKERVVGKAVDGSSVTDRELAAIGRVLTSDTTKSGMPNLLHGEYLERVFLEPKIGESLVKRFFPLMKKDLDERLQKVREYQPYAHPEAPFINAMEVWKSFAPKVAESLNVLLSQEEATPETFSLLATMYLEQKKLPPDFVKKMLSVQLQQYSWLRPDPMLEKRNLSLFGFGSIKDWFGPVFIEVLSQCVVNGAAVAKGKGIVVTAKEARGDLLRNVVSSAEKSYNQKVSLEEASGYLLRESQLLGLDEKSAVSAWQKVTLFKRHLDSVGENIFHDPLLYSTFASFAAESAKVEMFELPEELRFASFNDLMTFQVYLEKTAPKDELNLDLPQKLLSAVEVEKVCPELVEEKFNLEISSVSLEDLARSIALRDTWEWEAQDAHWPLLKNEFSVLKNGDYHTVDQRLNCLDSLDEEERLKIDAWARLQMVKADGTQTHEALSQAEPKQQWSSFRSSGTYVLPIEGVKDIKAFVDRLRTEELIDNFTEDGTHYYTIRVLGRGGEKHLLSFAEAKHDEVFLKCVERKLEEAYPQIGQKDPKRFQVSEGKWKPLNEVKETLGAYLYASLLREIEKKENHKEGKTSFEFYSAHRFAPFLRKVKSELETGDKSSVWIAGEENAKDLPWQMKRKEIEITRSGAHGLDVEELFALNEGAWSQVSVPNSGGALFYHLLSRSSGSEQGVASLSEKGKKVLADEAKRSYFEELMQLFSEKKVISLIHKEEIQ